jgi:hypothetical protein
MSQLAGQAIQAKALTQGDMEAAADNQVDRVPPYYATDLEEPEEEEVPADTGVGDDDDEERVEVEADDGEVDEAGDGETYISAEDEEELNALKRKFFQIVGKQVEEFHDVPVHSDQSEREQMP